LSNVLIVHAHPEPKSLTSALKDLAVETLTAQGHAVQVSDLYAANWKAVADRGDFLAQAQPDRLSYVAESRHAFVSGTQTPDVEAEQQKLLWADAVLLSFPMWWFGMPAILKGWVDRVLISGLVYGGLRFYDRGGLKGKKAMLAVTIGGQPHMLAEGGIHGELEDMLRPILRGTLAYTGMTVLPPFVAYHVPYIKPEQRNELMAQYRQRLRELDTITPLRFPSMDDYDATLRPRSAAVA
jgi:NAD(P)H dehydrogenase (quinone)